MRAPGCDRELKAPTNRFPNPGVARVLEFQSWMQMSQLFKIPPAERLSENGAFNINLPLSNTSCRSEPQAR